MEAIERRQREGTKRRGEPRYSQLAFLDDVRGMGKTSLLLSPILLLSPMFLEDFEVSTRTDCGRSENELPASMREPRRVQNRIVWLDTSDMEPGSAARLPVLRP